MPHTFESPSGRLRAATWAVGVATVLSGLDVLGALWPLSETADAIADEPSGADARLDALELSQAAIDRLNTASDVSLGITFLTFVAFVPAAVFVIRRQNVAIRNQMAFGVRSRYTPGQAAWSWFVPIWAFFGPKKTYNDLWRAAEPEGDSPYDRQYWLERPIPVLFLAWWTFWLVGTVVAGRSAVMTEDTLGDRQLLVALAAVSSACTVIAGVLFLLILRRITERHDALAPPPAAAAAPDGQVPPAA